MKEVQKIALKVLVFGLDILLFTWQVIRRVLLPTRSRKGNVLSSLLTFFVGLLERVVSFEKSILQRPVVFTHKYVKQGLIVAVGFLFLLSSLEWTIGPSADATANGSSEMIACAPAVAIPERVTPEMTPQQQIAYSVLVPTGPAVADISHIPALNLARPPVTDRRWLRFRVFRI